MTDMNERSVEEQEMEILLPSFVKKGYIDDIEFQNIMSMDTLLGKQNELYKIMMEIEQNAAVDMLNTLRRMTSRIATRRNNNAMHPLLIQMIADRIFGFLPTNDILNCRLVCRQWNTVSSEILSERVTIEFKTMKPTGFLNVWNHSLATDVKLRSFKFCANNEEGWNVSEIQNFFEEWGSYVTQLTFTTNCLFAFNKNNGLSNFDITPWILMATNLISLHVDVNFVSRKGKDKTLIVIQLCKLNFIKDLTFEGKGCVISIDDVLNQNMRIQPDRIIIANVAFQKGGKILDYFRLNDVIDFSHATDIWLTNYDCETEIGVDMASELPKAESIIFIGVQRLENWSEAKGSVDTLHVWNSSFLERTQLEINKLGFQDSSVNLSALPATIKKLEFYKATNFVATPNSECQLPNLTYLHLESCSAFEFLSLFAHCSNLVDVELGGANLNEENVVVNVHWIPKNVKRLKINSRNVKMSLGGDIMYQGIENNIHVLKLDTLILEDYLHCLDTDVRQIMSKIKPSVLVVTCKDREKVINTTSICDFVCANKELEKIVVGSEHDLHKNIPFDMSVLSHFVKEKANHYIFENLRENERCKENGNDIKEYIGKHLSFEKFCSYRKLDGIF